MKESIDEHKEEKEFLKEFYDIPEIETIIKQAQYCVLVDKISLETLARQLAKAIRKLIHNNKITISNHLFLNLEFVIRNLIQCLTANKKEFINYTCLNLEENYIRYSLLCGVDLPSQNTLLKTFERAYSFVFQEIIDSNLKDLKIKLKNLKLHPQALQNISLYAKSTSLKYDNNNFSNRLLIISIFLIILSALFQFFFPSSFTLSLSCSISPLILFIAISQNADKEIEIFKNAFLKNIDLSKSQKYSLQDVRIFEIKSEKKTTQEIKFLPFIAPRWITKGDSKDLFNEQDVEDEKKIENLKKRRPKLWFHTLKTLLITHPARNNVIQWNSNNLLLQEHGKIIPKEKIFPLKSPLFKKKYYGFFNDEALQELPKQKKKRYQTILKNGEIVSGKGKTGVKKLKLPIFLNKKIFESVMFDWSAKIISKDRIIKNDRLLGTECDYQIDEERQEHVLIDFCVNYKMH